ncbi:MAG TPA: DNRLRE domain-containing protein [Bacteroidales bacterium]|nr:DNRLRE domain-containing protein [Bacteroidales bacterium]HSA43251.1 DNRLRE domain-containing protein [Bacteroidales bacterium]
MKKIAASIIGILVICINTYSQVTEVFTIDNERGQDALIDSYTPTTNYGNTGLLIAAAWTLSGNFFTVRSLLDFGLIAIPPGSTIIDAKLNLKFATYGSFLGQQYGNNACTFSRLTEAWDEDSVTWNNKPADTSLNQVLIPATTSPTQDYVNIDVTQVVQDHIDNPLSSFGFLLKIEDEVIYRVVSFASSEWGISSMFPSLTVIYSFCPPPVATFTYSQNAYTFNFSSITTNATSWTWDFGDGNGSSLPSPTHVYTNGGFYHVCLTVTDSCGSSMFCDSVFVCDYISSGFSWSNNSLTVSFSDSSINATTWFWDFGDGNFSILQNPLHYYIAPAVYNACLFTTNACDADTICALVDLSTVGMADENITDSYILVYPNPSMDKYFIQTKDLKIVDLDVFSANGRRVFQKTITTNPAGYSFSLNHLPEGLYFLRITDGENVRNIRIVKQ